MPPLRLVRAFLALWWTTGVVIFLLSAATATRALDAGGGHAPHVAVLAVFEAVSAILFLLPRTLRAGAVGLLLTFAVALLVHGAQGQFQGDLLVYAAVVVFVWVHGPVRPS